MDGRRTRDDGARRGGDLTAALPGAGAHARPRRRPGSGVRASLGARRSRPPHVDDRTQPFYLWSSAMPGTVTPNGSVLRIAVPNKGSLAEPAAEMLSEAGYRRRTDGRELVLADPTNNVEFF